MKQEMININANLLAEPTFSSFDKEGETVEVANFTLVKKYGKGKEYINCAAYGEKAEKAKDFEKGDLIHIFGYFKKREKEGKTYKNFVVKSYNKIEKKEENEEEEIMEFFTQAVNVLKILVMAVGAGLGAWGVINLMEGYGNDNPGAKSQGIKQLMAGGGIVLIGLKLIPLLANVLK